VLWLAAMTEIPNHEAGAGRRTPADDAPKSALALLLAVGLTIGAIVPLGRVAAGHGVPPIAYVFWFALGGGLFCLALTRAGGLRLPSDRRHLGYYFVAGVLSLALPHGLVVVVVPHIGAGLASVLYILPAPMTYSMALALGLERARAMRLAGLTLGLAGALLLVGPRSSLPDPAMAGWLLLGLGVPVSLAVANIFRTVAWPGDTPPLALATGMLLTTAVLLFGAMAMTGTFYGPLPVRHAGDVAVLAQAALAGPSYLLFFRLQQRGGPVYLSQIGYVITAVGVVAGAVAFEEAFTLWMWLAIGLMAVGLALVNRQQG